ncbi:conserved hypothetical protein [Flavobacterium sp. 9AF]|uniref:DUF1697 domain-containing protein n=1 Tax=Flavobacterium sp. 9AF TaxID=2653142 RepID=UPI0012F30E65|nr:DUF1697 domain-containing protein [Flavobacterium sp. 9AF]VXB02244.1 conserved hypothetical protein [Flavobacterium sp. 9AF]
MTTHLALLRGINVSGHNIIKMETLKSLLENIGFKDVTTYIQSGNVFLKSSEINASSVGFKIKQEIFKTLGFDVSVIIINKQDLEDCFTHNSFLKEINYDTKKLYVAFLSKEISKEAINDLKMSQVKPDECLIDGNKIFIKYNIGAGKTKFDQKYIEKKLQVTATIRNWNTVTKLLELYKEIEI